MKISISGKQRNLDLSIPNRLIFNGITVRIACAAANKEIMDADAKISPAAMNTLFSEMNRMKKKYGTWNLVEVESTDGEKIRITL